MPVDDVFEFVAGDLLEGAGVPKPHGIIPGCSGDDATVGRPRTWYLDIGKRREDSGRLASEVPNLCFFVSTS